MYKFYENLVSSGIIEQLENIDTVSFFNSNSTGPIPDEIMNIVNSLTNIYISSYSNENDNDSNEPIQVRLNNIASRNQENKEQYINDPLYILGNMIYSSKFTRTSSYINHNENNFEEPKQNSEDYENKH
jgi:hypothetical protein